MLEGTKEVLSVLYKVIQFFSVIELVIIAVWFPHTPGVLTFSGGIFGTNGTVYFFR